VPEGDYKYVKKDFVPVSVGGLCPFLVEDQLKWSIMRRMGQKSACLTCGLPYNVG